MTPATPIGGRRARNAALCSDYRRVNVAWLRRKLRKTARHDSQHVPRWRLSPVCTPLVRGDGGEVVAMGAGASGNEFIGVAGREIKTATEYNSQSVGTYSPGEAFLFFSAAVSM